MKWRIIEGLLPTALIPKRSSLEGSDQRHEKYNFLASIKSLTFPRISSPTFHSSLIAFNEAFEARGHHRAGKENTKNGSTQSGCAARRSTAIVRGDHTRFNAGQRFMRACQARFMISSGLQSRCNLDNAANSQIMASVPQRCPGFRSNSSRSAQDFGRSSFRRATAVDTSSSAQCFVSKKRGRDEECPGARSSLLFVNLAVCLH